MYFEFQPLLTISKGVERVGGGFKLFGCMTQFGGEHTATSHFPTLDGRCLAPNIYPFWSGKGVGSGVFS